MRWLSRRGAVTPRDAVSTEESRAEAKHAQVEAQVGLDVALSMRVEVSDVVSTLKLQKKQNHFGELLRQSMQRTTS